MLKLADFGFQSLLLYQVLESGLPVPLVCGFVAIVVANALVCAAIIGFAHTRSGFYSVVADSWYGTVAPFAPRESLTLLEENDGLRISLLDMRQL